MRFSRAGLEKPAIRCLADCPGFLTFSFPHPPPNADGEEPRQSQAGYHRAGHQPIGDKPQGHLMLSGGNRIGQERVSHLHRFHRFAVDNGRQPLS